MPIDLSTAFRTVLDNVLGVQVVDLDHARAKMNEVAAAINALSGTVTFDSSLGTFGSITAVQAASGIADADFLFLAGVASPVDAPPIVLKKEATAAANTGASFVADGVHWHFMEFSGVTEKHFAVVGDGTTDDTNAFQNFIDWVNWKDQSTGVRNVEMHLISDRIRCTRPVWYCRGEGGARGPMPLYGNRRKTRGESGRGGTQIIKDFEGGMLFIVHAAREFEFRKLSFAHGQYDMSDHLNFDIRRIIQDSIWDQIIADRRYSPECFIAVDPFYGADPGSSQGYVNGTGEGEIDLSLYPAANQTLYGTRLQTSRGVVDDCSFEGIGGPGLMIQSNSVGNGDFIDVTNCNFEAVRWPVSIGTGQSRSMDIRNNVFNQIQELVTTAQHGAQAGRVDGVIENNSGARARQLFRFHDLATGSNGTRITKNYIENGYKYGDIVGGGAGEGLLRIEDASLNISSAAAFTAGEFQQPGYVITGAATRGRIKIDGFTMSDTTENLVAFEPPFIEMTGGRPDPAAMDMTLHPWERIFHSGMLGFGFNFNTTQQLRPHQIKARGFDESTGNPTVGFGWTTPGGYDNSNVTRKFLIPLHQWEFRFPQMASSAPVKKRMNTPQSYQVTVGDPAPAEVRVTFGTDRVDVFRFGDRFCDIWERENFGGANGDGLFNPASGTMWGVFSVGTVQGSAPNRYVDVLAFRMNNYREASAGVFEDVEQITFNGDNLANNRGAWANSTVYAAGDVVQDVSFGSTDDNGCRWFQTALGGTSSGTQLGDDTGVTDWVQVQSSDNIWPINLRMFATDRAYLFNSTNGDPDITVYSRRLNAGDIDALINANTGIQVGDRLFDHEIEDAMFVNDANRITAIVDNGTTATITMAGNAGSTVQERPFVQFIKAPPANVATPRP